MVQPPRTDQIQCVDAQGCGLFVRCDWSVDRYQHRIGWLLDGVEHAALESCEGSPADDWPLSPPMQQFSMQQIDGNPALLGVGMAGRGHWSASFILLKNECVELVVELACLVPHLPVDQSAPPQIPISTYRVINLCRMQQADGIGGLSSITLQKQGLSDLGLNVRMIPGVSHFRMSPAGEHQFAIEPVMNDVNKTCQWSYQIDFVQTIRDK